MKRTAPASEIDPTGAFERAYAETAGVPVDAVQRKENAMTGKTDELLPCPFGCNGDIGHINRNGGVCYVCVECGASGPFSDGDPEEPEVWVASRAAWNRRTQPAVKALVWQENSTYAKVEFGADTLYYSIDQVDEKLDAWSVTTRVIGSEFGETEVHRCIGKTNALAAANAVHERFVLSLIHTALVSAPADPAPAPADAVGRVRVPAGQTPLNDKLDHRLLEVFREGMAARDSNTGSPYHGHSLEHCLHASGWVSRDLRLALDAAKGGRTALGAQGWRTMDSAPKDGTKILVCYDSESDPYQSDDPNRLTPYGTHAEGGDFLDGTGITVAVWVDGWHERGYWMPGWWFAWFNGDTNYVVAPTGWLPLDYFPAAPTAQGGA